MLSHESDTAALTSAATSLASLFTFSTFEGVVSVLGQPAINRATGLSPAASRRTRREVFMVFRRELGAGGSFWRLVPDDVGQQREDEEDEEYEEEDPGYLRGRAGDPGEPANGGYDCHNEEDQCPA